MPVLGHAFVGVATGVALLPEADQLDRGRAPASLWLPASIGLAYVPDVAERLLSPFVGNATLATHSFVFALALSLPAAAVLRALFGVPLRRGFAVCAFSIGFHDVLDLFHADDRAPLWPLWNGIVDLSVLPSSARAEVVIFGGWLAAFLLGGWLAVRPKAERIAAASLRRGPRLVRWASTGVMALLFVVPFGVYKLRAHRDDQLEDAQELLDRGRHAEALAMLGQAERWPSSVRAERLDHLRAEAYDGLGDRPRAEAHYLRAYRADPRYFWIVADLAAFYASGDEPKEVRRERARPYLDVLEREFAGKKDLPRVLERIRRRLDAEP
jgi:tetratricopeptide (TPR) repeat protein